MINTITVCGRLTHDPELRSTKEQDIKVCSTSIANETRSGENKKTNFINVVFWRGLAENVCKYLRKGAMICVTGQLVQRDFTDNNGIKRTTFDVVASDVQFMDKKPTEIIDKDGNPYEAVTSRSAPEVSTDELPF